LGDPRHLIVRADRHWGSSELSQLLRPLGNGTPSRPEASRDRRFRSGILSFADVREEKGRQGERDCAYFRNAIKLGGSESRQDFRSLRYRTKLLASSATPTFRIDKMQCPRSSPERGARMSAQGEAT
jgi:hypothetical protein